VLPHPLLSCRHHTRLDTGCLDIPLPHLSLHVSAYTHCRSQDLVSKKQAVPFKSPSAILQEHVNPEHAAHFAAVAGNKDTAATSDASMTLDPSLPSTQKPQP
jgi:hypothetical protein